MAEVHTCPTLPSEKWLLARSGSRTYYFVSNLGRLSSVAVRRDGTVVRTMLKLAESKGYLYNTNVGRVHRLVAELFVPGQQPGLVVNHMNGVKSDNRASNLEWVTQGENVAHAVRTGLMVTEQRRSGYKLTEHQVINMRHMRDSVSLNEMGRLYGVHPSYVSRLLRGSRRAYL
jgi:hypothetical protein